MSEQQTLSGWVHRVFKALAVSVVLGVFAAGALVGCVLW